MALAAVFADTGLDEPTDAARVDHAAAFMRRVGVVSVGAAASMLGRRTRWDSTGVPALLRVFIRLIGRSLPKTPRQSLARLAISTFVMLGAGIVIWIVGRVATRASLDITPAVVKYRGTDTLELKVLNQRPGEARIRASYIMFVSGAGMAFPPPLPGSAPLPLDLPRTEVAYLRYSFKEATHQLTHHRSEVLRGVACLVDPETSSGVHCPNRSHKPSWRQWRLRPLSISSNARGELRSGPFRGARARS